ncbi:MAG TPA: GNAT family N-acetyltransferase [Chloroflexia bacterium]|nr:GNAT family N-acetyltransferase [Chloroflexia bacterium]
MQYRPPANQGEMDTYIEMVRLAFNSSAEDVAFWQSIDPLTPDNSRCLFDDDGKLLCGMGIIDEGALYFNNPTPIPTALITAVASPPEHRRKGYIRELFVGMFDEQRAKGVALSALYPFYFPFYRTFGYELAHDAAQYTVKIEQFKPWRKAAGTGTFTPIDTKHIKAIVTGDGNKDDDNDTGDLEKLDSIYKEWAIRNLGAVSRSKRWWLHKFTHKKEHIPTYLYYNAEGRPSGYIIYHLEDKGEWVRELAIHEMMAVDHQAWEAIYGFIYNHDSQASKVTFWMPVDAAFASRLPDPREAEVKVHSGYMLRLLDVEEAFRQRTFQPEIEGEFTFAVADEILPINSGIYHLQVRDGKANIEKLPVTSKSKARAGVRMDARALAQLYGGYIAPVRAAATGQIEVLKEDGLANMQAVLSPSGQPTPYMADDF